MAQGTYELGASDLFQSLFLVEILTVLPNEALQWSALRATAERQLVRRRNISPRMKRRKEMQNDMQTSLTRLFLLSTACFTFALLSGCALTKDYVSLSYVPQTNVAKIAGADAVTVRLDVTDVRTIKDKVSAKKNGYGVEMAAIIAKEDVAGTVKTAIETELENRGFRLGGGGVSVVSELSKFYSYFKAGSWSGSAVAKVTMNVQVKKADGSIGFSKLVTGKGGKEHLQLASGSNAKVALDSALRDAVSKLFSDAAFIDALLKAAKSQYHGS